MKDFKLKIEYVPIDTLTPYEKNARRHANEDVDVIANSIKEFGMNDAIGVWGDKNIIVEGHGRFLACKKLGITEVPIVRLDHLNNEQRKAYALAHNRSAELSDWDYELVFEEIHNLDFNFNDLGFSNFLENDNVELSNEPELKEHNGKEKEIECPFCGEKFLI